MQTIQRRVLGTLIIAMLLALVWLHPLDTLAKQYTETGLQRAFTTFAAARAMNAALSVLQSTAVNFQIVAGGSIQLGAVLDPLDDLVEQFSALMLASTLSFAVQRLLIEISGAWPISVALSGLLITWGFVHLSGRAPPQWLPRLALGVLCLRLAVPVVALGSEITYRLLLDDEFKASQAQITNTEMPDTEAKAGQSLMERFKDWWTQNTDFRGKIEALKSKAENWIKHIVKLAAVFIVQTMVLPLLFVWGMLKAYRILATPFCLKHPNAGKHARPLQLPSET